MYAPLMSPNFRATKLTTAEMVMPQASSCSITRCAPRAGKKLSADCAASSGGWTAWSVPTT